ncbi:MAG TPA: hypothetical protein PKA37_14060, partial [Planctomycetota bacterium]|nr:hypothetical protein [Planctomycetota bacterium]
MSSATGTFLSRDPIWSWGSLYSYVGNRPTDRIDPMGLQGAGSTFASRSWQGYEAVIVGARAPTIRSLAQTADAVAREITGEAPGSTNGPANAYLHCLWTCLMGVHFGDDLDGEDIARRHEIVGLRLARSVHGSSAFSATGSLVDLTSALTVDQETQLIAETNMDLHNNGKGRWCAEQINKFGRRMRGIDCVDCCSDMLVGGWLAHDNKVKVREPKPGITPQPRTGGTTLRPGDGVSGYWIGNRPKHHKPSEWEIDPGKLRGKFGYLPTPFDVSGFGGTSMSQDRFNEILRNNGILPF